MNYSIRDIVSIINGKPLTKIKDYIIEFVQIDSRTINYPEKSLFFAINGPNNNGHDYIIDAFKKGVRSFVIEKEEEYKILSDKVIASSNILYVKSSIKALQNLAEYYRKRYTIPVIGITGSNGKTIVKEWLYQLLYNQINIYRSPKSYNSQIGVPLSIYGLNEEHDLAVFEAGISTIGEMENLERIIKPEIGIFTNLGPAHQEGFKSNEEKIKEKLKLFRDSKVFIYCQDHKELHNEIHNHKNNYFNPKIRIYTWSSGNKANLNVTSINKKNGNSSISGTYENVEVSIDIPFIDKASIENAIHCWLFMLIEQYPKKYIQKVMLNLSQVEMRLELKEGINNCTLINDTYNSDMNSLSIALDYLMQQSQHKFKTLILSDILQSGKEDKELYIEVAKIIKNKGVTRLIGVGTSISSNSGFFDLDSSFYDSTNEFLQNLTNESFDNEAILIKGARIFSFENITQALQRKVHNTILELNLQSLVNNLSIYRKYLKSDTKIMAMVKAFSYGSGSHEIAGILQYQNVDYLAVAYADEGVELRKAGINMPIMVMSPDRESFSVVFSNKLEPEIYSLRLLNQLVEMKDAKRTDQELVIHIKIDSGMHRLGFVENDIDKLIQILKSNPKIKVRSIFSHLMSSDDPANDDLTRNQIRYFDKLSHQITESLDYPVLRHILNSAGVLRFPEAQFDMVRLGIGLYGFDASNIINDKLENVSTFKTIITQIKNVKKGERVGYSGSVILNQESRIAIIGVGYADGFPRALGNGVGTVVVNGKEIHTIGNICMDMAMVDISGIEATEGDEVIIFGKELPIHNLADKLQTIPYEVLTNISSRVKRVYYK